MGNCHANIRNWIKMEQDFMSVPIVCMFDEDLIKNEVAIVRITFSPYVYGRLNGKHRIRPNCRNMRLDFSKLQRNFV